MQIHYIYNYEMYSVFTMINDPDGGQKKKSIDFFIDCTADD